MKRTLTLAAMATLAAASAHAQSSLTIYGRLNVTLERQKDGDVTDKAVQNNASRIGFRGVEDLGGGLRAGFLIEHGFSVDTGAQTQTAFWARESNVFLEGPFGKVRLGNMGQTAAYYAIPDYISMHNHDTGTSADAFYLYPGRPTNMVAYTSPKLGPAFFEAQVSEGDATTDRTYVLAGQYQAGPVNLAATYLKGPVDFGAQVSGFPIGVMNDGREFGLRALYQMGPFALGAYYIRNRAEDFGLELKRNAYRLSGMYTMGQAELHVNVGRAGEIKGLGINDTEATQMTVGINHNLSKRTKLYAFYTRVNNKANINYLSSAPGNDFSSVAAGIRHNF
jgi:predicted porin